MPPFPGEERLVTLFTDCHYYFGQPAIRPVLHRFDKASYFYIYYNATRQTSRIEVANNPGTPDQDAFNGQLDNCRVINSHKFPTLVTLIVDATDHVPSPTTSRAGRDPDEWRLASADPRDVNQTKYRIHTIDFYFWTQEDAYLVTNFFKKLLGPAQLDIAEPQSTTRPQQQTRKSTDVAISPVVQNLENVAISDPAYGNGQTRNSQNQPQKTSQPIKLPPPPPPSQSTVGSRTGTSHDAASPSPVSPVSNTESQKTPQTERSSLNFTPMAYNPAAPAAPEKIAHREKTPPPEDGTHGTGLSSAALHDQPSISGYTPSQSWGAPPGASHVSQSSHWGSPPPSTNSGYGSPPPPSAVSGYGSPAPSSMGYTSPPPPPGSQYQPSRTSVPSEAPSFAPPPMNPVHSEHSHRHSTAAETYTPDMHSASQQPVETPGTQFYNTIQQPQKPLQHVQPHYADYLAAGAKSGAQPPPGGWSDYSYSQGGSQGYHSGQMDYNVHNTAYRPTEEEAHSHSKHKKPSRTDTALSNVSGNTEGRFSRWKSKVNKAGDALNRL